MRRIPYTDEIDIPAACDYLEEHGLEVFIHESQGAHSEMELWIRHDEDAVRAAELLDFMPQRHKPDMPASRPWVWFSTGLAASLFAGILAHWYDWPIWPCALAACLAGWYGAAMLYNMREPT